MSVPISNVTRRVVFAPSGTGPYAFTFEILANTDIQVYKGDTLLTLTTDYTVTINSNGTGSVTLVATAGTDNITIVGARAIQRTTDFVTGGDLFANSLNTELDSLTIFTQQNAESNARSIKAPVTDPTTINMTLPTKTARAGKYLSFNSSTGNPEVVNTVVDITAVAANAANINTVAGQISPVNNISTVAGQSANITTVAGIAANVTTVAGIAANVTTVAGISADVTTVAADGTDIGLVAAVSSDVAALGPIAADITTVAGIDSDVTAVAAVDSDVTAVAGVAANVTTVAGIAANVTTVAGISADVTTVATNVTDITNFSDVYLGPKSSDPSVRNDSSALQAGDLYFDTVADAMKVYTGSAWVAAYISGTGFVDLSSTQTITGVKTFDNGFKTDTISEETSAAGVTVDGVLLKDSAVSAPDGGTFTKTTATTNAVTQVLRVDSQSSGTPANGIGVGIEFATETAAGNTEVGATIEAITTDVTSTSEDFDLSFKTMAAGAAAAERMRVKSTGDFQFNSGYGSVATAYGCRAWVNFDGTGTPAIREDGNVSSITDNGTGDYTVNFTTAMPDANYSITVGARNEGTNVNTATNINQGATPTTTACRIQHIENSVAADLTFLCVAIFR